MPPSQVQELYLLGVSQSQEASLGTQIVKVDNNIPAFSSYLLGQTNI